LFAYDLITNLAALYRFLLRATRSQNRIPTRTGDPTSSQPSRGRSRCRGRQRSGRRGSRTRKW